jgi:acyl-CoA reductase-like NAD-dependent aldehyde dehydrogenase
MREIAARITSVFGEIPRTDSEAGLCLVFKEPIGPSLLIAPWNAAFVLAARGIFSMLAAGCTVVFKASELCPRTHHFIAEVLAEAGLPSGALNVIQSRREDAAAVTETLIAHRAIRKVEFIGSPAVGKIIGQLGGKYLKPVLMELGGKCAAIVLDDANFEDAAAKCIQGAFMHHGQICFSTERIIVLESVADKFIELLKLKAEGFAPGSGASGDIVRNAHDTLVDAEKKGAKFLIGGPKYTGPAELLPTIVTGVTRDMRIFDIETFGPSVSVYVVKDDEAAIEAANDSVYGLNASIHTRDMNRAINVGRQLEFGQVHVNSLTAHNEATFPIGGTKGSGWGRNNSLYGIEEFVQLKTISLNFNNKEVTFGRG